MKTFKILKLCSLFTILLITCQKKDGKKAVTSVVDTIKVQNEIKTEHQQTQIISKETDSVIIALNNIIYNFNELKGYKVFSEVDTFFIKGDFFGDQIEDIAILIELKSNVKLCVINFGQDTLIRIIGNNQKWDFTGMDDFSWAGKFRVAEKGEILWSNYVDDFRRFKEVPESEKVILDYDAIYVHASESCGGGYIFWQDEKFKWLQQE